MNCYLVYFVFLLPKIWGSPITFELVKGRQECYYVLTPEADCTISYYFAVQGSQTNNYNVDYQIFEPGDKSTPMIERTGIRQGEWSFPAENRGEYGFCFHGGSESNKILDLDIQHSCENEADIWSQRRKARKEARHLRNVQSDPLQSAVENSVDKIEEQLYLLERNLIYYKSRNKRNHHTVRSTDRRILLFSIYAILLVIGMGLAEITLLKWFFKESRKHAV
ncbi:ERP3 (YDL018C) [Zygosaccharomyces parabailii]|nr:ERP3 (YDL018C) [Zygosaccharomyces parabailii]CDH16208.1 probable protein ERP3 [Zygosaccharomyces bailii ISA1307]SJM88542.1 probable protein ERP3 [Zygosaccharomyces bailii]